MSTVIAVVFALMSLLCAAACRDLLVRIRTAKTDEYRGKCKVALSEAALCALMLAGLSAWAVYHG